MGLPPFQALGNSEVQMQVKIFESDVFLKSKMVAKGTITRNFPSAFIAIPSIINRGRPIATILSVLSNSEDDIWTKVC